MSRRFWPLSSRKVAQKPLLIPAASPAEVLLGGYAGEECERRRAQKFGERAELTLSLIPGNGVEVLAQKTRVVGMNLATGWTGRGDTSLNMNLENARAEVTLSPIPGNGVKVLRQRTRAVVRALVAGKGRGITSLNMKSKQLEHSLKIGLPLLFS
jgi:hypothetical protein